MFHGFLNIKIAYKQIIHKAIAFKIYQKYIKSIEMYFEIGGEERDYDKDLPYL